MTGEVPITGVGCTDSSTCSKLRCMGCCSLVSNCLCVSCPGTVLVVGLAELPGITPSGSRYTVRSAGLLTELGWANTLVPSANRSGRVTRLGDVGKSFLGVVPRGGGNDGGICRWLSMRLARYIR